VPTTNIFDTILQAASAPPAAPTPGLALAAPAGSPFDGTRTQPSAGFVLPVAPATKNLFGYQAAAVESILAHSRVILGFQPGMGKTAIMSSAIAALAAQGKRTIMVVPPANRISPWAEDFSADFPGLRVHHVTGQKAASIPQNVDVVIVGDSLLAHRLDDLQAFGADAIMMDEAHRMKTRTSKRSIAALAMTENWTVETVVMATGTLATNNAADVYMPLRISGVDNARAVSQGDSYTRFMDAWCQTEMRWTGRTNVRVVTGCKDVVGLRNALVTTCMLSVPRDEVLDLPERTFPVRSLVLNGDRKVYDKMEKDFIQWVYDTKGKDAAKRAAKAEAITRITALWKQDGLSKVKATVEYVMAMVDQGEQVIVFAQHTDVITALYTAFAASKTGTQDARRPVITRSFTGANSAQSKADVVTAFQAGNIDVLIGQVQAAGVSITLHASSNVVFAQLPWTPATFGQAADRIYRIGQRNACQVHVLNGMGMVSEHLWNVLLNKAHVVDAINTGKPCTIVEDDIYEAVLSSYGW